MMTRCEEIREPLILRRQKKEKIFRSGFTAEARQLILVNGVFALAFFLLYFFLMKTVLPLAIIFFVFGVGVVIFAAMQVQGCVGKKVTITPAYITIERGGEIHTILWRNLKKFTPPVEGKTRFRKAILGDDNRTYNLDSLSFEEFDLLVSVITVARKTKYTTDVPYDLH